MQKKYTRLPYIISLLCAFVVGIKQIREPDIWWQLLTGRWMLEHGEVTRQDMFSYTMEGTEWINVKWLYEVIIAFIEKGLGPHGVMLLQSLVNVAIVYLLLNILSRFAKELKTGVSTFYATIGVILFLGASEFRMAGRPEMMSHLMTALYMFILWRSVNYSWKSILWLVPLQCLWANMHDGYPVGMVIIAIYIGGALLSYLLYKSKEDLNAAGRLSAIWGGMALAIIINPNTIQLWKQPFEIFRQLKVNKYTTELFSIAAPEYWTFQSKVNIIMLGAAAVFLVVWLLAKRRDKSGEKLSPVLLGYMLSVPVFGYLSMTAMRNIPFTQIVIFPVIPVMLSWLMSTIKLSNKSAYRNIAKHSLIVSSVFAAAFFVLIVSNEYYKFTNSPDRYGLHISTLHNPTATADFIERNNLEGPVFSDYFASSYLLWRMYPDFKSYIDLRDLDIFPQEFFDDYFEMYTDPKKFNSLDSTYKFNYVVLTTAQSGGLLRHLYWGESFNVIHVDPVCMIMLRNTEENRPINQGPAARHLFTWPQDPLDPSWAEAISKLFNPQYNYEEEDISNMPIVAGKFYNSVGNSRIAVKFLLPAVQSDYSNDADALTSIGNAYLGYVNFSQDQNEKTSWMDSARWYFERSLLVDDKNKDTYLGLAAYSFDRQNFQNAKEYLEAYLKLNDKNDYVYYLYGLSCRQVGQATKNTTYNKEVIDAMERSVYINPDNKKAYLFIAESYMLMGEKEKAKKNFKKVMNSEQQLTGFEKHLFDDLKKQLG